MIIFVQPFGLNSAGGGARILRALLTDAPQTFLSICGGITKPQPTTIGEEIHIPTRPTFGRVESTRYRRFLAYLLPIFKKKFMSRLEQVCVQRQATAMHSIPHGIEFWYAYQVAQKLGIPYYLNVHDDLSYNLAGDPNLNQALAGLSQVWAGSAGRFVISEEMGQEYCRRYGQQDYTIVTDGLTELAPRPKPQQLNRLRVYFAGALHLTYQANVDSLIQSLALLKQQQPDISVSLVSRGSFISSQQGILVENRPWASEAEVAEDLEDVDLLYLPLPFAERYEAFYRFSLSTKMVTYLGSGLPILYHGPANAAAGRLLSIHQSAISLHTLDPSAIAKILSRATDTKTIIENALLLGKQQFMLEDQRQAFWEVIRQKSASTARNIVRDVTA